MASVLSRTRAPRPPEHHPRVRAKAWALALAGPALIVVAVLIAMRGFVFHPLLTNQHADIMSFILPRYCYLGERLALGQIPLWNPWLQAGTPFASDPQSGWMYAPPMLLFSLLPCTAAMRAFIVLQPLLAGLGLYWFLRRERLRRTAATVGGLAFAMAIAGSAVGISMPFAASLAWTPFVLVGASGFFATHRWSRRLMWMGLAAFAWGQVAGAHMSHGLFMCTLITGCYVVARAAHAARVRELSGKQAILLSLLFMGFLPLANLAFLLPRLALVPRSGLKDGYAALGPSSSATLGVVEEPLADGGVWSAWPFALASTPGAYVGAAVLLCVPAAFRSGRKWLLWGFGAAAVISYAMTLDLFVGAGWFRNLILRIPFGDVYIHNPSRLRHLMLLIIPVLGALGVQGLMTDPPTRKATLKWLAAGGVIFLVIPLLLGAYPKRLVVLMIGIAMIAWPLVALARGRSWARIAVPLILAVELLAATLYGNLYEGGAVSLGLEKPGPWIASELTMAPGPLRYPDIDAQAYLEPGAIAQAINREGDQARFLTWSPPTAFFIKGYLFRQDPKDWPALFNGRGMLFRIPDPMGYNPFQLARYWQYLRATNELPLFYNAAVLQQPSLEDARLLGARWLITPRGVDVPLSADPVTREGDFVLSELRGWEPRVSVVPAWQVEDSPEAALEAITEDGFDPGRVAVLETDPGIVRVNGARPGSATYREFVPEDVRISAEADAPSIVVVRNAYDENWSATVDGVEAPVLVTDAFLQGVAIPAGKHEVRLTYDEPAIWVGLAAASVPWGLWWIALLASLVHDARRRRQARVAARRL